MGSTSNTSFDVHRIISRFFFSIVLWFLVAKKTPWEFNVCLVFTQYAEAHAMLSTSLSTALYSWQTRSHTYCFFLLKLKIYLSIMIRWTRAWVHTNTPSHKPQFNVQAEARQKQNAKEGEETNELKSIDRKECAACVVPSNRLDKRPH